MSPLEPTCCATLESPRKRSPTPIPKQSREQRPAPPEGEGERGADENHDEREEGLDQPPLEGDGERLHVNPSLLKRFYVSA